MRFDVLSRELDVFGHHFLEASAGTGKTFAIEHLAVRLLIDGDSPFSIEQILVVTFTRAATRELKLRIRRNLSNVKEALLKGESSIDYLNAVLEKGEIATKAAIDRIDAALICFDSAQIYTLHGFCHRVLKEFAFEANVSLEVSDPEKQEHLFLLEQLVRDHLLENVTAPHYSPFQIKSVLKKNKSESRKMVSSLCQLISSGKEIALISSHSELLELFLKEVRKLPQIDREDFKADLSLLLPQYKQMTDVEIPSQIDLLAEILSSKECSKEQFDSLLIKDFFLEKMRDDNKKIKAKFPEPSSLHYPGLVEKLRISLLGFLEIARDPARTFLRLAKDLQEKASDFLEKREKLSPDALLLKVQEALQSPIFARCVRQKFRAAIVDEFQDTDPVQWDIFQKLFLSNVDGLKSAVCLVGDPKQSIYAFRNADVYVYQGAAKAMGESSKKYLDTNFRSTEPLVNALNLLFSRAKGGWMDLPKTRETLEVIPVKSGAGLPFDEMETPVEFFVAIDKKGRSKSFPTAEMFESKVFPYLAAEIHRLHTEKGIEYHDIAILIKDRFQGKSVIDYLKRCGIPVSAKRGGLITETTAYHALKEALAAACAPFDLGRLKTALGGPLIAWKDEDLSKEAKDLSLLEAKAKMQLLSQVLFEQGFGPFFQSLLSTAWGPSRVPLLQELFSRGELPLYLDLRKLSELLIEEEIERGLKGESFLTYLEEIALEAHLDESRLKVASREEKGSVTVMTMHMSKGLEFEVVFALGLASRRKPSEQLVIKDAGRSIVTLFDANDPASQRALEEQDAEKMRQLYVALTRAKRRLYIPLMIEEDNKGLELGEASPSELFFSRLIGHPSDHADLYRIAGSIEGPLAINILESLSPLISYRVLQETPEFTIPKIEAQSTLLVAPSPLSLPSYNEQILSFSSLAKKEHSAETIKLPLDAPLSPHTMPFGSDTGILLHSLFEKIFKRGLHHPLQESSISEALDEEIAYSPLEAWRPVLLPWAIEILKKPLITFSLSDVPKEQLCQEMEFFFRAHQGMMKGFADLVFEFDGKYYLVDWKSNYLGPADEDYTQEKIAEAMHQHQYYLQASIYTEALERYVKLFDTRPFSEIFGGAIYYFIRGKAIFHFIPERFHGSI